MPLPAWRKAQLAGEVLTAYGKVRWWLPRHQLDDVVARLRQVASAHPPGSGDVALVDPESAQLSGLRLGRAVSRTLRLLPTDSRCLVRSLVLTALLARRGLSSSLVIGVRSDPEFAAHAWVEHAGRPLLPPGEENFLRLVEL